MAGAATSTQDIKNLGLTRERPVAPPRQPSTPSRRAVFYPTSDGKPMAETDKHISLIIDTRAGLRLHYSPQADSVYVSGNNFVFYEEGNSKARLSPDGYVVFGVPQRERDSYKVWEEGGHLPAVVFEFTSKKTQTEDMREKYRIYEQVLKVPEYILFDPTGDFLLDPRLRGFRLVDGRYVEIPLIDNRLYSEQLGLYLVIDGVQLRFYDPLSGRYIPTLEQAELQRQAAEERRREAEAEAVAEREARLASEAEAVAEREARLASERESARLLAVIEEMRRAIADK